MNFGFFAFLKIISRGRYSTSDDSASIFRGKRKTFNTSDGKSPRAMVRSRKLCSQQLQNGESLAKLLCFQLCNFHFWRKSRTIAACLLVQLRFFWQVPCRLAICSSVRQVGGSDRSARYKGKYKIRWKMDRHIDK